MAEPDGGGRLSVVATPIGNLADMSPRAVDALRSADLILCEDTRQTRKLCAYYGIDRPLQSLHEHNEGRRAARLVERLREGAHLALVSDAGTPTISDPGSHLIAEAAAAGIRIEAVPGPSAVIAALSISGFPGSPFAFFGFMPPKPGARRRFLDRVTVWPDTAVLFISPHRGASELAELAQRQPERPAILFRELTKRYETALRGTLDQLAMRIAEQRPRGEWTLVLGPFSADANTPDRLEAAIAEAETATHSGASARQAAFAAADKHGLPPRRVYRELLRRHGKRRTQD